MYCALQNDYGNEVRMKGDRVIDCQVWKLLVLHLRDGFA